MYCTTVIETFVPLFDKVVWLYTHNISSQRLNKYMTDCIVIYQESMVHWLKIVISRCHIWQLNVKIPRGYRFWFLLPIIHVHRIFLANFLSSWPSGVIKWSMLIHAYQHKPLGKMKWPSAITRRLRPDVWMVICKHRKRIWSYMTPDILTDTSCN